MGIAQRQIRLFQTHIPVLRIRRKALLTSIQMPGDQIQVKRYEKNLTHWQVAQKRGIATASIRDWERRIECYLTLKNRLTINNAATGSSKVNSAKNTRVTGEHGNPAELMVRIIDPEPSLASIVGTEDAGL